MRLVPFLCFLAVIFSLYYEEVEARESCCKNYRPSGNVSDPAVRDANLRDFVRKYWKTCPALKLISKTGHELIDVILNSIDTAPKKLLLSFASFTGLSSLDLLGLAEGERRPLCHLASIVNASVKWSECGNDGRSAVEIIKRLEYEWPTRCMKIPESVLGQSGCRTTINYDSVPIVTECYEGGLVYDIEMALAFYGRNLPCPLLRLAVTLYHSHDYVDRLLALAFVTAISDLGLDATAVGDVGDGLELFTNIVDPVDDLRCCEERKTRMTDLCFKPISSLECVIQMYSY